MTLLPSAPHTRKAGAPRSAIIPLTHVCSEPLDDFAGHAPVHAIPSHPSVGSGGEQAFLGRCINMHMLFIWSRRTGPPSVHSAARWAPISRMIVVLITG